METVEGMATVEVPCTCGELVQGVLEGEPFLVSCPIDRYSRVTVVLERRSAGVGADRSLAGHRPPHQESRTKAVRAVEATLEMLGLRGTSFALEVACPLVPSKGYGTSTADVVGAIVATALAAGASPSVVDVARLAVAVEPSDGTMFSGLALFDHRSGRRWEALGDAPPLLVAVLEFSGAVDTLEYNAGLDMPCLLALESEHVRALDLLRRGLRQHRPDLIGEAATLSARINQRVLPKPQLEAVIALGREYRALGVCAAHSGTVLGLLFPSEAPPSTEALLPDARDRIEGLERIWISRMVNGGARVLSMAARR